MSESRRQVRTRILGNDSVWLQDGPQNWMVVNALLFIDPMSAAEFREVFRQRMLTGDAAQRNRRLMQTVELRRGQWWWGDSEAFELERQIVDVAMPHIEHAGGLQAYVGAVASQALPEQLPRWRVEVIQDPQAGHTVLFFRIHHCIADGIALVRTMFTLFDTESSAARAVPNVGLKANERRARAVGRLLRLPVMGPVSLLGLAASRADRNALHGDERLGGRKSVAWSTRVDFQRIRRLRQAASATINDLLMTCLAGALARCLERPAEVRDVRAFIPMNLRSPKGPPRLENQFVAVPLMLPVDIDDPIRRLRTIEVRTRQMKGSVRPVALFAAAKWMLRWMPDGWSREVFDFFANKCTCVLTNVPGPPDTVYLDGRALRDMFFWVPQRSRIGIGISIFSYAGSVRLGVISDGDVLERPDELIDAFSDELDGLEAILLGPASTESSSPADVPGEGDSGGASRRI